MKRRTWNNTTCRFFWHELKHHQQNLRFNGPKCPGTPIKQCEKKEWQKTSARYVHRYGGFMAGSWKFLICRNLFGDPFFGVNMWPTPVTYWGCRKNETLNFWCAKLVDLSPTQPTVVSSHQWTQQSAYAQCGCWHEQSTQWTVSSQHDGTKQLGHVIQLGHAILRYWYHLKKTM